MKSYLIIEKKLLMLLVFKIELMKHNKFFFIKEIIMKTVAVPPTFKVKLESLKLPFLSLKLHV